MGHYATKEVDVMKEMIRLTLAILLFLGIVAYSSAQGQYLPLILSSEGPAPLSIAPPEGITLHYTNPQMIRDRAGVIWAATRANSSIGGVVWKQAPGQPIEVVLQLGPAAAYANGELVIWPDGLLYYITVPQDASAIVSYRIDGWTP
jgi:hypothetical protein